MPYIKEDKRKNIDEAFILFNSKLSNSGADMSMGELNYIITKLLLDTSPTFYDDYNSLIGVLESCKLEFYRRAVAIYEDGAIERNGDVY
jgi:hypothetical protein